MNINLSPFKALRIPAILASLFAVSLLAYYYFWVAGKATYLEGRNFRLLATAGRQVDESIESQAQIIRAIIDDDTLSTFESKNKKAQERVSNLTEFIAELKSCVGDAPSSLKAAQRWSWTAHLEQDASGNGVRVLYRCGDVREPGYRARFSLDKILKDVFGERAKQAAFGSVLLAKTGGEVVFQLGVPELQLTRLDKLTPAGGDKTQPTFSALSHSTNAFKAELSGAGHHIFIQPCCQKLLANDPRLPGAANQGESAPTNDGANRPESDSANNKPSDRPAPGARQTEKLVLCGLISARRMTYNSMEISFSLLALITGVILAASFSWPFLKLSLIGERQRVQLIDVLLVGACAVLLISLITLAGLDFAAYANFKAGLARNLIALANEIKGRAQEEIAGDYAQLSWFDQRLRATGDAALHPPDGGRYQPAFAPYTEFFQIDENGKQFGKQALIPGNENPSVNVREREYFINVRKGRTWPAPMALCGNYVLESIRSWTTGQKRAVLVKQTNELCGQEATSAPPAKPTSAVALGLGLRLRSLVGPVVPYGFGFAVIDDAGTVLFHSDEQRNLIENFFAEADNDRRLRAAVAARHAEEVSIRYGGQDYLAYVSPFDALPGAPWHVITFYDKQLARTLNVEWLTTAVLLLALYALIFILFGTVVLLLRPGYRAPWLWPDAARILRYRRLVGIYLLFAAFLAYLIAVEGELLRPLRTLPWDWVQRHLPPPTSHVGLMPLVGAAASLCLVWLVTFRVLAPQPQPSAPASESNQPSQLAQLPWITMRQSRARLVTWYSAFWFCHLLLVAVLPTVIFFKVAHRLQTDAYFKHAQLKLALDFKQSSRQAEEEGRDERKKEEQQVASLAQEERKKAERQLASLPRDPARFYGAGFLHLEANSAGPTDLPAQMNPMEHLSGCNPGRHLLPLLGPALPGLIEAQTADHPLFSVQLKEMSQDKASDDSWQWARGGFDCRRLTLTLADKERAARAPLIVATNVPTVLEQASAEDYGWLAATIIALSLLLLWTVRFACRRIFLIDLMPPVWRDARGRLQISGGYHTFIVCRTAQGADAFRQEADFDFSVWRPAEERKSWRIRVGALMEMKPLGLPVVLDHFEQDMHDYAFNAQKIDVIEELIRVHNRTVIVRSTVHPAPLFAYYQAPVLLSDGQQPNSGDAHARRWEVLSAFCVIDVDPLYAATSLVRPNPIAPPPELLELPIPLSPPLLPTAPSQQIVVVAEPECADAVPAANGYVANFTRRLQAAVRRTGAFVVPPNQAEDEYRRSGLLRHLLQDVETQEAGATQLDRRDLLEEVDDRAGRYYYELWAACTPPEKTVLVHLAQDGFLNEKDRRTIRRLMMRGFIVRAPHLRLESSALRGFLLTRTCQLEAAKLTAAPRSDWDSFKWPFLIVLGAAIAFFFATQQELFNATIALITGIVGSLPMLIRVIGLLLGKRTPAEEPAK